MKKHSMLVIASCIAGIVLALINKHNEVKLGNVMLAGLTHGQITEEYKSSQTTDEETTSEILMRYEEGDKLFYERENERRAKDYFGQVLMDNIQKNISNICPEITLNTSDSKVSVPYEYYRCVGSVCVNTPRRIIE